MPETRKNRLFYRIAGGVLAGLLVLGGAALILIPLLSPAPVGQPGDPVYGLSSDADQVRSLSQDVALTFRDGGGQAGWFSNLRNLGADEAETQIYLPLFFGETARAPELPEAVLDAGNLAAEAVFLPYDDYDPEDLPDFRDARDFMFRSAEAALPELEGADLTRWSLRAEAGTDCFVRAALTSDGQPCAVGEGFSAAAREQDVTVFTAVFRAGEEIDLRVWTTGGALSFAVYEGTDPDDRSRPLSGYPAGTSEPAGFDEMMIALLGLADTGMTEIPEDHLLEGGWTFGTASRLMASRLSYDFRSARAVPAPGLEDIFCGIVYAAWTVELSGHGSLDFRVTAGFAPGLSADGRAEVRVLAGNLMQEVSVFRLTVSGDLPVTGTEHLISQGNRAYEVTESPAVLWLGQAEEAFPCLSLGIPLAAAGLLLGLGLWLLARYGKI